MGKEVVSRVDEYFKQKNKKPMIQVKYVEIFNPSQEETIEEVKVEKDVIKVEIIENVKMDIEVFKVEIIEKVKVEKEVFKVEIFE